MKLVSTFNDPKCLRPVSVNLFQYTKSRPLKVVKLPKQIMPSSVMSLQPLRLSLVREFNNVKCIILPSLIPLQPLKSKSLKATSIST